MLHTQEEHAKRHPADLWVQTWVLLAVKQPLQHRVVPLRPGVYNKEHTRIERKVLLY